MWIDTDGTFRPERIISIAQRYEMNADDVLDNIVYARVYNTDQQFEMLVEASALLSQDRFALIIVDSVTALYRVDYNGRAELYARQTHLGRFMHHLHRFTAEYGVDMTLCCCRWPH